MLTSRFVHPFNTNLKVSMNEWIFTRCRDVIHKPSSFLISSTPDIEFISRIIFYRGSYRAELWKNQGRGRIFGNGATRKKNTVNRHGDCFVSRVDRFRNFKCKCLRCKWLIAPTLLYDKTVVTVRCASIICGRFLISNLDERILYIYIYMWVYMYHHRFQ